MIFRILILSLGAFVWQVTELLPIGLLTDIAQDLHVSASQIGLLVTGYAWLVALTAIPLTIVCSGINRRILVAGLMALVGAINLLSAMTPTYTVLALLRIVLALGHGVFWSILSGLAVRLAPELPIARVTGMAFTGVAVAFAGGIPLASAIGHWLGWRAAFSLTGVLGVAVLAGVLVLLPPLPGIKRHIDIRHLLGQPVLRYIALLTACAVTAHFTAYTYIVPLLQSLSHATATQIPLMLLVFGCAGIIGNWLGARLSGSAGRSVGLSLLGLLVSFALLLGTTQFTLGIWGVLALWGIIAALMNLALQSYALELAPHQHEAAASFCVTGFNAGIGTGALIGGLVLPAGGALAILGTGTLLACAALVILTRKPHLTN
ncbi:sugar transporter [Acetobacter orientalis]|uniref:MFS transporter n=1 Tax=Acetobacter orientalis TaxID=146474 RepID=UPI000A376935|nr:MFS transporter [Acetobacter orientalis]MCP1220975.1 MFS transporter [Acetobacter orientalis]OUJ17176.1 sugar transporter [Acetobacter orientalis]